jgi:hypothetical protein
MRVMQRVRTQHEDFPEPWSVMLLDRKEPRQYSLCRSHDCENWREEDGPLLRDQGRFL